MLPSMECYDCYLLLQRCFPELLLLDRAGCARRTAVAGATDSPGRLPGSVSALQAAWQLCRMSRVI